MQKCNAKGKVQQGKGDVHRNRAENHAGYEHDAKYQTKVKVTHKNSPYLQMVWFVLTNEAYIQIGLPAGMSTNGRFLTTKNEQATLRQPALCEKAIFF